MSPPAQPLAGAPPRHGLGLRDLLELEDVEPDLFRSTYLYADDVRLYGGQVAAQALLAAGLTVANGRLPHSMHGYFLRVGHSDVPTIFQVHRDRDGRSYSARRVVARQEGQTIFTAVMSFAVADEGLDSQVVLAPTVPRADALVVSPVPRLLSIEWAATPDQPSPDLPYPERFWARCTDDLGDDLLLHACAITYISDCSSGLVALENGDHAIGASIDHAVWFHRPVRADDWLLNVMSPQRTLDGRGLYTGSMFDADGALVVSLAQQALMRRRQATP